MLSHALKYASFGYKVLPLKPNSKCPLLKNWQSLATSNTDIITTWFDSNDCNIGILTGDNLMVLDCDGENGQRSLDLLELKFGRIPNTSFTNTGGGGQQYFFRTPYKLGNRVGILPNIDIRCDGGQVVVPPSIHGNGNNYTWGVELCPIKDLPQAPRWLLDAVSNKPKPSKIIPTGQDIFYSTRFPISSGTRHYQTVRLVSKLICAGHTPEETYTIVMPWLENQQENFKTCMDSVTKDTNRIIHSAAEALESGRLQPSASEEEHTDNAASVILHIKKARTINDFCNTLKLTENEKTYLFVVAIQHIYEKSKGTGSTLEFKSTDRQILKLMEIHSGRNYDIKTYQRIKKRFVTTGEKLASKIELLQVESVGTFGVPSVYSISKYGKLLYI